MSEVIRPVGPVTLGLDVSNRQGAIDWEAVAWAGRRFAFVKASEDGWGVDPWYATHRREASAVGIRVYPYHYAHPDAASPAQSVALLQEAADDAQDVRTTVLYSAHWFMAGHGLESAGVAEQALLWLASWQSRPPPVPEGWSRLSFWQFTSSGRVPGVGGDCDEDVFFGTEAQLDALGPIVALDIEEGRGLHTVWAAEWCDLARRAL